MLWKKPRKITFSDKIRQNAADNFFLAVGFAGILKRILRGVGKCICLFRVACCKIVTISASKATCAGVGLFGGKYAREVS